MLTLLPLLLLLTLPLLLLLSLLVPLPMLLLLVPLLLLLLLASHDAWWGRLWPEGGFPARLGGASGRRRRHTLPRRRSGSCCAGRGRGGLALSVVHCGVT